MTLYYLECRQFNSFHRFSRGRGAPLADTHRLHCFYSKLINLTVTAHRRQPPRVALNISRLWNPVVLGSFCRATTFTRPHARVSAFFVA